MKAVRPVGIGRTAEVDRVAGIRYDKCKNTITVDLPDPVYRDFQDYAERVDRPVSELVREALELDCEQKIAAKRMSLLEMPTVSVGRY